MAERSKAPDSRMSLTFPLRNGSGRSGLRMEAWVRIPLLTTCFSFTYNFFFWGGGGRRGCEGWGKWGNRERLAKGKLS